MSVSRTYKSPLREEQMEQTRERILETLAEILVDESISDVSVAVVAERARVSVRTAYRYFPTKEAMFDALNVWMRKRFGSPPLPTSVAKLPEDIAHLIRYFSANERLMRASRSLPLRELRSRRKLEQARIMTKVTAEHAPHLDAETVRRRAAALHIVMGSDIWMTLRDTWGFSEDEIIDVVQWALRSLGDQLAVDDAKAKKRR